jgi:hypothetical protein
MVRNEVWLAHLQEQVLATKGRRGLPSCTWVFLADVGPCRPASCRRGLVSARRWLPTESHPVVYKATWQGSSHSFGALVALEIDNVELRTTCIRFDEASGRRPGKSTPRRVTRNLKRLAPRDSGTGNAYGKLIFLG